MTTIAGMDGADLLPRVKVGVYFRRSESARCELWETISADGV
jgi:hypothetical protein